MKLTFQKGSRKAGAPDPLSSVHLSFGAQPCRLPGLKRLSHLLVIDVAIVIPVQGWHSTVVPARKANVISLL